MEKTAIKIPIFTYSLLTPALKHKIEAQTDGDPFSDSQPMKEYYGPNAKWLLDGVLRHLNILRKDEIAILTTSDERYVSTCVSITCFNYAKISRVVGPNTKVVIVIHEFGYVYPDINNYVNKWKERGIVVIEDCAHIIGCDIDGKKVGSFGDYALFSLPKIIPARAGGLLRTTKNIKIPVLNSNLVQLTNIGIDDAEKYLPKYKFFNEGRLKRAELLKSQINGLHNIFEPSHPAVPYFLGIVTSEKSKIEASLPWIEFGATLRNDLVYIPTNPLVDINLFKLINSTIQNGGVICN